MITVTSTMIACVVAALAALVGSYLAGVRGADLGALAAALIVVTACLALLWGSR